MKFANQIKSISYLKAHAAQIARDLAAQEGPLVITQNGEATLVLQDIQSYQQTQDTLALLKILALGNKQIQEGRIKPAKSVIARLSKLHESV